MDANRSHLRYVDAGHLGTTEDPLAAVAVISPDGRTLGTLAGALVDPGRRHVRFLVVESRGWFAKHQYVLPFNTGRFDREHKALVVESHADELREVRVDRFAKFSDEDLIEAIFSPRAA